MSKKKIKRKGSKFLGNSDRIDVLLETITIFYTGTPLLEAEEILPDVYASTFKVFGRVDVTDFIDPITGQINVPIEWLLTNVKGFAEYIELNYQERMNLRLSLGLRSDKYSVEWRQKKSKPTEGFKQTLLAKSINNKVDLP